MEIIENVVKTPNTKSMTPEEIDDLFGEDPYLGQTSYLQSPESFSVKKKKQVK